MGPLIGLTDPRVTDALGWGTDKVDFIWYDQEHGPMSPEALQSHIIAAHGRGIAVIVRVEGPNVAAPGELLMCRVVNILGVNGLCLSACPSCVMFLCNRYELGNTHQGSTGRWGGRSDSSASALR